MNGVDSGNCRYNLNSTLLPSFTSLNISVLSECCVVPFFCLSASLSSLYKHIGQHCCHLAISFDIQIRSSAGCTINFDFHIKNKDESNLRLTFVDEEKQLTDEGFRTSSLWMMMIFEICWMTKRWCIRRSGEPMFLHSDLDYPTPHNLRLRLQEMLQTWSLNLPLQLTAGTCKNGKKWKLQQSSSNHCDLVLFWRLVC